jgi:hypothetical protein
MNSTDQDTPIIDGVDGIPVRPNIRVERNSKPAPVEGLDEDECADASEMERCAIRGHWPWWLLRLPGGAEKPGEPWFPD